MARTFTLKTPPPAISKGSGRSEPRFVVPEWVDLGADAAAKLSCVVMALSLIWLLNGLLSGHTARANDMHVVHVVTNSSQVFRVAACICAVTLAWSTYRSRDMVFLIGLAGIAFAAGLPALVQFQVSKRFMMPPETYAEKLISQTFHGTGIFVTAVAIFRGLIHFAQGVTEWSQSLLARASVGVEQKARQNSMLAKSPSLFTPCWRLPYCRDGIREICPAFIAKKTCWKFGSGCYCDDDMIMKIINADPTVSRRGTAFMHATLTEMKSTSKRKGKPPCDRCYIFLEHQRLKHNLLSPLAVPLTIGLMYLGYPVYESLFTRAAGMVTAVWQQISYAPINTAAGQASWFQTMESIFAFVAGFFILVYMTKAMEFAIFKLKW